MSALRVLFSALAVTGLVATQAYGLTITNRDASSHTVLIQQGDQQSELSLGEGASVEEACEEGCVLRLAGNDEDLAGTAADKFVIEGGALKRQSE